MYQLCMAGRLRCIVRGLAIILTVLLSRVVLKKGQSPQLPGVENAEIHRMFPSGNSWHSYWKWPFIVSFPIKNGDFL